MFLKLHGSVCKPSCLFFLTFSKTGKLTNHCRFPLCVVLSFSSDGMDFFPINVCLNFRAMLTHFIDVYHDRIIFLLESVNVCERH